METVADIAHQRQLMPISLETLCVSDVLAFDVYLRPCREGNLSLYCRRGYPFTQEDLDHLRDRGTCTVWIASHDAVAYRDHLRENVLDNEEIPAARRYQIMRDAAVAVLQEHLEEGPIGVAVQSTRDVSQDLVQIVCNSQPLLHDLLRVMSHDYGMFTHAMNVSTYCLLIAQRLGIRDDRELLEIGQGALLHDIGKRHVPAQILEKEGKLNEQEMQIVMQHPGEGFLELCHREDVTWGELMMVYQHHERCDGRGYPAKLVRSEIHEYGRLCAIADVTDAMLRDRPHRNAWLRSDFVKYLDRQAGRAFDEEMTQCWIATIKSET